MTAAPAPDFDASVDALPNGTFVEASAGTGKTWSIATVIAREIALDDTLRISQVLVTTFTRNAAAELRDRVRRRMVDTAGALLAGKGDPDDRLFAALDHADRAVVAARARNLMRAVIEYDTASIATIHSICSKVLSLAGVASVAAGEDNKARLVAETVNDALVNTASVAPALDEARIRLAVAAKVKEPLTPLWFDDDGRDAASLALLARVGDLVEGCARTVVDRSVEQPSFDDIISRARVVLADPAREPVRAEFRRRYRYVMVDEAQDTDAQQWAIFSRIFPLGGGHDGSLVAVGDPKQSIYRFRGADIDAYTTQRSLGSVRTLSTNWRSDQPLLDGVNDLFAGSQFGPGISYVHVDAPAKNARSLVAGVPPVEVVACTGITEQVDFANAVAARVAGLLTSGVKVKGSAVMPRDVVVLVKSGPFGQMVESRLRRLDIPAVSTGTSSVMEGETAEHWRILLRALERVSDEGRTRHVMLTPLFGHRAHSPALRDDRAVVALQTVLAGWAAIMRTDGVAAMVTAILGDADRLSCLAATDAGERRLTDFTHIGELLHAQTAGEACSPDRALEAFEDLCLVDRASEVVSRRVESDADAVQIMTIHVAKGLEFPLVVVADLWKPELVKESESMKVYRLLASDNKTAGGAPVSGRVIDVGWVVDMQSALCQPRRLQEAVEEYSRLLYVAVTRAKHHVTVMHSPEVPGSIVATTMSAEALSGSSPNVSCVDFGSLPAPAPFVMTSPGTTGLVTAPLPGSLEQTYRRTSFTGITEAQRGHRGGRESAPGGDEGKPFFEASVAYAPSGAPFGVGDMPLSRVPGGTHVGTVFHNCMERIDPGHPDLEAHVRDVVARTVRGRLGRQHAAEFERGILAVLRTPLGPLLGDNTLVSLGLPNLLAELSFEMSLAHLSAGVTVRDVAGVLLTHLPGDDVLVPYASLLDHPSFAVPLAGLINGSIDALIRVPAADGTFRLFVSDYKTNRLDREGDARVIDGYVHDRMLAEMAHHHYPLQALIYGTAVHRYLRWRAPHLDADATVAGLAYLFVRGMTGPGTPVIDGRTSGVFVWEAPAGLWTRLSALFAGERP
jgi:exodeoxyribonuclease V beta subunit